VAQRALVKVLSEATGQALAHLAVERGLISSLTLNAIQGVAVMRNLAVHGPRREITSAQVDEHLALVESVLFATRQNIMRYDRSGLVAAAAG